MAKRRRHAAARTAVDSAAGPSMVELAAYGLLGALVAAGVLLLAGKPLWQAVAIVVGAVVLLLLLAIVSARGASEPAQLSTRSSTGSRHGRRRRR